MAEAERERLRVRAATKLLLERVDGLARKTEEEATQVCRFRQMDVFVLVQSTFHDGAAG